MTNYNNLCEIPWEQFNGTDTSSVINFYNLHIDHISNILKSVNPDDTCIFESEAESYSRFLNSSTRPGYWFHEKLQIVNKNQASLFHKMVCLSMLDKDKCNEFGINVVGDGSLGRLVYTVDKYDPYKNAHSDRILTSLVKFTPYIETSRIGTHIIRWQGTKDGKAKIRYENIPYEQMLLHGPDNMGQELICVVRGAKLSQYERTNFSNNTKVQVSDGQWHHVLYNRSGSIFKTNEPSKLLIERPYKQFTHEQHVEMLGCVPLCGDAHDAIHSSNIIDGIDHWFKRLEINECKSLPFHFYSEVNYNKTILWLFDNTDNFDITRVPDYQTFIQMLSTKVLQTQGNISLQEFCSLPLSKNHPILQRSTPYNKYIEWSENLGSRDTQPTSLSG